MNLEKPSKKRLDKWKRPINEELIFSGTASVPSYAIEEEDEKITVTNDIGHPTWSITLSKAQSLWEVEDKKKRKKPEEYQYEG